MSRLETRIISLEEARADRAGKRDAERLATTSEFCRRIVASAPASARDAASEGESAAAALMEFLNNGGDGDEAA